MAVMTYMVHAALDIDNAKCVIRGINKFIRYRKELTNFMENRFDEFGRQYSG